MNQYGKIKTTPSISLPIDKSATAGLQQSRETELVACAAAKSSNLYIAGQANAPYTPVSLCGQRIWFALVWSAVVRVELIYSNPTKSRISLESLESGIRTRSNKSSGAPTTNITSSLLDKHDQPHRYSRPGHPRCPSAGSLLSEPPLRACFQTLAGRR